MINKAEELFEKFSLKQRRDLDDLMELRNRSAPYTIQDSWSNEPVPVTCSSVAKVLCYDQGYEEGTSVLVYAHDELQLHSWLISKDGLLAYHSRMISRKELEQCIQEHRLALGIERIQESRTSNYRKLISLDTVEVRKSIDEVNTSLSELLIPPSIASALQAMNHLVIVPVYSLGVVPFAMLKPFANKDTVLLDYVSISIAPSLFDLDQLLGEKTFFNAIQSGRLYGTPLIAGLSEFPHIGQQFSPLPGVRKEIESVAKVLGVQPLLNSQATKKAICSKAEDSRVLYIATHGFADENESYLVLWPEEQEDGIWSGQEIHDMRFENAYAAILSACQTGLGRVHDAGMIGVARSFQMGGVPRVVVSLWSIKDEETAVFMVQLVQNMSTAMVAEALRETALKMRRDYPDPAVWASFSLFGTPR